MRSVQIAGETLFHNDDPAGLQFDEDELEVFENYDADFEDSMDNQIEARVHVVRRSLIALQAIWI